MLKKSDTYTISFFLSIVFFSVSLRAQEADSIFFEEDIFQENNQFSISLNNSNLFINNEFFSPVFEGYTLTGSYLNPIFNYQPAKNIALRFGLHLMSYSGRDSLMKMKPIIGVSYRISDETTLNLGYLKGGSNHQMIDPIFHYEHQFSDNVESGLQFLFNKKHWKSDIWINWEQFIFPGDAFQEIFTFGTSTTIDIFKTDKISLKLPIQSIARHHGGQINAAIEGVGVETIFNSAIGGKFVWQPNLAKQQKFYTDHYLVTYSDLSPTKKLPFIHGYGYYSVGGVKRKRFSAEAGYWFGDYFITAIGMPLYAVYNPEMQKNERQRSIVHAQFRFQFPIYEKINFSFRTGVYYDLYNYSTEHFMALFITYNDLFYFNDK